MRLKKFIATAAVTASFLAAGLATAAPASADIGDADCAWGSICLYYSPENGGHGFGAYMRQGADVQDYAPYTFSCGHFGCAGAGQRVRNNAASVDSHDSHTFVVYYSINLDCSYACQTFAPYADGDLNGSLRNNNASGEFR